MKKQAFGVSHAKIILIGDHSVVYGQPAIAFPLKSVRIRADVIANYEKNIIDCEYFYGNLNDTPAELLGIKRLIQKELEVINPDPKQHFTLKISSAIPSERGMGSSAATAIAVTRALANFFEYHFSHEQLLKIANVEEKITHGSPSGIDSATTSSDLPVWLIPNKSNHSIPMNVNGYLVIADSGIKGHTDVAVNAVRQKVDNEPQAKEAIEQLGTLTTATKNALATGKIKEIGKYMSNAQRLLAELGVSIPPIDALIQTALNNGALGGKLTGSGLGGCIVTITDSRDTANQISKALENAGAVQTWIEEIK